MVLVCTLLVWSLSPCPFLNGDSQEILKAAAQTKSLSSASIQYDNEYALSERFYPTERSFSSYSAKEFPISLPNLDERVSILIHGPPSSLLIFS